MPSHYLDLRGASTLETDELWLTRRAVRDLSNRRGMGVVHGAAGTGKTFAVQDAVEMLPDGWEPLWVTFPVRPTMRLVASEPGYTDQ